MDTSEHGKVGVANTLIVIPARGGSKGIPRKNLRILGGKPLIAYTIEACLDLGENVDVVITSDDPEIKLIGTRMGANVIDRPSDLCADNVTLDPVVYHAFEQMELISGTQYQHVVTIQPTSPFVSSTLIKNALKRFSDSGADTLISVIDDTHLTWRDGDQDRRFLPNYEKRLNRQWLPKCYKESGSILICNRATLTPQSRFGANVELFELGELEGVDIDTPLQWTFCESIVNRRKWVFVVTGDYWTGSGHAFRVKTIAEWLAREDVEFCCLAGSELARDILNTSNYEVRVLEPDHVASQIVLLEPDIVVNDILDTKEDYVQHLKKSGALVVNFEDFGPGADAADLVINALYHSKGERAENRRWGETYFCLRSEFQYAAEYVFREKLKKILITFGGTDCSGLTQKTLRSIGTWAVKENVDLEVILGPGFSQHEALEKTLRDLHIDVSVRSSVSTMSSHMLEADLCITSCGRTVYELASLGVPTVCLAQNEREETHTFARLRNGVIYLGRGDKIDDSDILKTVVSLSETSITRKLMWQVLKGHSLNNGIRNVLDTINHAFHEMKSSG